MTEHSTPVIRALVAALAEYWSESGSVRAAVLAAHGASFSDIQAAFDYFGDRTFADCLDATP